MANLLEILTNMHPEVDFETHQALVDDKVLDSFDIITLVAEINDQMDIAVPAEELVPENFNSYGALQRLLDRLEDEE